MTFPSQTSPLLPFATDYRFTPSMVCSSQTSLPDGLVIDTTSNTLNSRMGLQTPVGAGVSDFVLSYPQFVTAIPEVNFGVAYTVTAAIEYPAGTFTPVYTTGGSRTLSVSPGRGLTSFLPCPLYIPPNTRYWVKTFASWTVGNFHLSRRCASWVAGDGTARGTGLSDNTLVAGTPTTTSNEGFGPCVYGRLGKVISVAGVIGDSITQTAAEYGDPVTNYSFIERAMRGVVPTINTARNSDSMVLYLSRPDGRSEALRDRVTHLFMGMGRNDMVNGNETSVKANYEKVINPFLARGVKVIGNTVTPYTTSSDGWMTLANQTQSANREACRLTFNQWLRDNWRDLGLTELNDWARVMDPDDLGKWIADPEAGLTGRSAQGWATVTDGAVASVAMGSYLLSGNSGGSNYGVSTTVPCAVVNYPGTPGTGAIVTGNTNGSGLVTTYTVNSGGRDYVVPPMVSPKGSYTHDGIHPGGRGYDLIISKCDIRPDKLIL